MSSSVRPEMVEDSIALNPTSTTYSVYVPDGEKTYILDIYRTLGKENTVLLLWFENKTVPIPSIPLDDLLGESRAVPSHAAPRMNIKPASSKENNPKLGKDYVKNSYGGPRCMRNRPLIPHLPDPRHYRCSQSKYICYIWDEGSDNYYGYSQKDTPIVHKFYTNTLLRWKLVMTVYDDDIDDDVETEMCSADCVPGKWYTIEMDNETIRTEKMAIIRESTREEIFEHDER